MRARAARDLHKDQVALLSYDDQVAKADSVGAWFAVMDETGCE